MIDAMRRPHSIADRSRALGDQRNDDRLAHEDFRLPLQEARTKARQVLNEGPAGGYTTVIENWRRATVRSNLLSDGCQPRIDELP